MFKTQKGYAEKAYEIGFFGLLSVFVGGIFWLMLAIPVYFIFGEDYAANEFLLLWGGGCGGVWLGMKISEIRIAKEKN